MLAVLVGRFIPFDPNQPLPLPADPREARPDGHPALSVVEMVEQSE